LAEGQHFFAAGLLPQVDDRFGEGAYNTSRWEMSSIQQPLNLRRKLANGQSFLYTTHSNDGFNLILTYTR
jgi:hypothetical protein